MSKSGWNDPPAFSYREGLDSTSKKGNLLNKRPTHPPTSSSAPPTSATPTKGPPIVGNAKLHTLLANLPPPPTIVTTTTQHEAPPKSPDQSISAVLDKQDILDYFNDLMDKKQSLMSDKQLQEINKRVGLLIKQWAEGKISETVYRKLSDLVNAHKCQDTRLCETIQVGLMVNHVNEVSQWMVGIKRLINTN